MSRQLVKRQGSSDEADINLTPMLDVVFIMLIFFIVTATFIKQTGVQVTKPDAETAENKPTISMLVAVNPNGEIWIDKRGSRLLLFVLTLSACMLKILKVALSFRLIKSRLMKN